MPNYRRGRINDAVAKELAICLRDARDPRILDNFVSVTRCEVAPDLKIAKVYYSALGDAKAAGNLDYRIRAEHAAYNNFFKQYAHSVSSKVSGAVNDTYLKSQGTEGRVSYGMVVDLTVAYLKDEGKIN